MDNLSRMRASRLLSTIGGKEVVPPLIAALSDRFVRLYAIRDLGLVGPDAQIAVPKLKDMLLNAQGGDRESCCMRSELVNSLGKIGGDSQKAVDALVLSLKNSRSKHPRLAGLDSDTRRDAANALRQFGRPGAEALITMAVKYVKDKRPENQKHFSEAYMAVAWGLKLSPGMIPVFEAHFKGKDPVARYIAGLALGGVGAPAIPAIAKYLDSKDPDLRAGAAEALGRMNWFATKGKKKGEKVKVPVSSANLLS